MMMTLYCRYSCFLCDYNLCRVCVRRVENERIKRQESSRQLVNCLKSMCDRVKEKVAEDSKHKNQTSFDSCTSILLDTDDIPLIDDQASAEDIPEHLIISRIRSESCSEDHAAPKPPDRRSVVSSAPYSDKTTSQVLNPSLPKKPPEFSPDVFHLRAPLVSWENFMTPAGSVETINDMRDGARQGTGGSE